MNQGDDEARRRWDDLIELALKNGPRAIYPAAASPGLEFNMAKLGGAPDSPPAASAMGVMDAWSSVIGGAAPSLLTQALPSGGTSWLKWLNPIAGLVSLFTGREEEKQGPLPMLAPRLPKRSVEYGLLATEGGALKSTDVDERGRIRIAEGKATPSQQIVVQVQTLDSRSFLDNRDEIASAVKQALMESHGLGTVLREFQE